MKKRILAAGVLAFTTMTAATQPAPAALRAPPKVPSIKQAGVAPSVANVVYASHSVAQNLDLYLPVAEGKSTPLLIYIHGGGFALGSRTMASAAIVKAFLASGFAVASVDYRLSGEARFPAAVQDVLLALAFLKRNASNWNIDGSKIVVYGESAGANLAALLGTAYADAEFLSNSGPDQEGLRPAGVIAHFPPVDFLQLDSLLTAQGCPAGAANHNAATSFESRYLGAPIQEVPVAASRANPAAHVKPGVPPFLIQNGSADCFVGAAQAPILASALTAAGGSVVYELLEGADHGGQAFETDSNLRKMTDFARSVTRTN